MAVSFQKLDEELFLKQRENVLKMWKTGAEVDLEEAIAYQKATPNHKKMAWRLEDAKKNDRVIMHNLCGMSTMEMHKDLLRALQDEGHSDLLHCIYDSMTRTCRFAEAEKMVRESERTGKNMLNGFPVVTYGVKGCRELFETFDLPFSALGPSIDSRLATEISLASGFSQVVLNTFIAFETYTKTVPLEDIIAYHQYASRLAGYYTEHGADIAVTVPTGPGGDNAPGICPTSLGCVGSVLGALMCAAQGNKHLVFEYHSHGNLVQDAAACGARLKLAREYLDKFGFTDTKCYLENGQMGGQYPLNFDQAFVLVVYAASISALTNAEVCQVKTYDEASNIPTKESQVSSVVGGRMMYNIIKTQDLHFMDSHQVREEQHEEEIEARAIIEKILELGDGDPLAGACKAYELGILDNPVASNPRVATKVVGIKDCRGAVRYQAFGNLPFTEEMKEYHRVRLAEREKKLGHELTFDTLVADMRALSTGDWISK